MARSKRPGLIRPLFRLAAAGALGYAARDSMHSTDEKARARIAATRRPMLDEWMPVLTDLGSVYAVAGAAAALYVGGRKRLARDVAGASLLAWCAAQGAKKAFNRERPYERGDAEMLVRKPAGSSFPSGHPAVAQAMASILAPELPAVAQRPLASMPRMVGFSRIYVGVHYPSDVLGGILVGKAVADLWRRYSTRG